LAFSRNGLAPGVRGCSRRVVDDFAATLGTDLEAAASARLKKESELAFRSKESAAQPKPPPRRSEIPEQLRTAFGHDRNATFKKDGSPFDPGTMRSYEKVTREFLDIVKRTRPGEITRQDLKDWIAKQRERVSHRTVCASVSRMTGHSVAKNHDLWVGMAGEAFPCTFVCGCMRTECRSKSKENSALADLVLRK